MGYIYKIYNDINDKIYIGLTTKTLKDRFLKHYYASKEYSINPKTNQPLYRAINKYGFEHFFIELIEECNDDILPEREQYWIKQYDSYKNGYNGSYGGEGVLHYDHEQIYKLLLNSEMTCQEIAKQIGCCIPIVYEVGHAYNINLMSRAATQRWQKDSYKNNKKNQYNKKLKLINQYSLNGEFIQQFQSLSDAAQWIIENHKSLSDLKGTKGPIRNCCNQKAHRKIAYGYKWTWAS